MSFRFVVVCYLLLVYETCYVAPTLKHEDEGSADGGKHTAVNFSSTAKSPTASCCVHNKSDASPQLQSFLPTVQVSRPTISGILPPVIHGNNGNINSDESDGLSHTAITVIAVCTCTCVPAGILVLFIMSWKQGWWKKRKTQHTHLSVISSGYALLEENNALGTQECTDSIPLLMLHPTQEESHVVEPDTNCSSLCGINAKTGGLVAMPCSSSMMWIPPGASSADQTIGISYCPIANLCCLPHGVIPLACPLRLHPHGFKYSKPAILVFHVPGNFFPLRDEQIRLFHSDNEDSPNFSELKESSCRVFTLPDGHQYVTCQITSHCLVVPCIATPLSWKLVAAVYVELDETGAAANLHVFVAADEDVIKELIEIHCSSLHLVHVKYSERNRTDDGLIEIDMENCRGDTPLVVNVEALAQDLNSSQQELCPCRAVPVNAHQMVWCTSKMTGCVVRVSVGDKQKARISVRLFDVARSTACQPPSASEQQPTVQSWSRPLLGRHEPPLCFPTRIQSLRQQGSLLCTENFYISVKRFLCQIGLTVESLLQMASSLLKREMAQSLEAEWQTTCSWTDLATGEQLDQFLIKYMEFVWSSCAEEVIARAMSLKKYFYHFQYCALPGMPGKEFIVNQFQAVLCQKLTWQSDMQVDSRSLSSLPTRQSVATTGPRPDLVSGSMDFFSNQPESRISLRSQKSGKLEVNAVAAPRDEAYVSIPRAIPPLPDEQSQRPTLDPQNDFVDGPSNPVSGRAVACYKDDQVQAELLFDASNALPTASRLGNPREEYLGYSGREDHVGDNARQEPLGDGQRE